MGKNNKLFLFIIGEWIEKYPPAREDDDFTIKLSSEDIREEISNFISSDVNDITEHLRKNGYIITKTKDGEIKWLVSNKKQYNT